MLRMLPEASGSPSLARIALAILVAGFNVPARAVVPVQDIAAVRDAARTAVLSATAAARHLSPPLASVDDLLRLAPCDAPLEAAVTPFPVGARRLTVRVVCPGRARWQVWVPVSVRLRYPIVVARRDVARGALVTSADLEVVERELDGPGPYVSDPAGLMGRRARADIRGGQPVGTSNTTSDQLVVRGQQVTLLTSVGGLQVTAKGIAQGDGGLGTRIRVRSASSSRVVEGVVRSSEVVEVLFPASGSG